MIYRAPSELQGECTYRRAEEQEEENEEEEEEEEEEKEQEEEEEGRGGGGDLTPVESLISVTPLPRVPHVQGVDDLHGGRQIVQVARRGHDAVPQMLDEAVGQVRARRAAAQVDIDGKT